MPTPAALRATLFKGAIPAVWQSQFRGILEPVMALACVFGIPK